MRTRPYQRTLIALFALLLASCSDAPAPDEETPATQLAGSIFGTFYQVTLVDDNGRGPALEKGFLEVLNRVDRQMSTYRDDSDLNRLNKAPPGTWADLPDELMAVLEEALVIAEKTNGAFDITLGGLVNLWTFGPEARPIDPPSDKEVAERLAKSGYQKLELDLEKQRARRLDEFYVDTSGLAKGYAVDAVANYLRQKGLKHFMVNIGGDIIAAGQRSPSRPWRVGVEVPEDGPQRVQHVIPVDNMALATSGDYRNYLEHNGKRYSHIIDPLTGKPITHRLASASVLMPSNIEADALGTAFMAMGEEKTMAYAHEHHVPVLLIVRYEDEFKTLMSPALEALLGEKWVKPIREAKPITPSQ